MMTEINHSKS